jgi:hypothetical protein
MIQESSAKHVNQPLLKTDEGERTKLKQPGENENSHRDALQNRNPIPTFRFRGVTRSIETPLNCLLPVLVDDGIDRENARADAEAKVRSEGGGIYGNKVPSLG